MKLEEEYLKNQLIWKEEIKEKMDFKKYENSNNLIYNLDDLIQKRKEELKHASDIRELYEQKLEKANNLYFELNTVLLQLDEREKDLIKRERALNIKNNKVVRPILKREFKNRPQSYIHRNTQNVQNIQNAINIDTLMNNMNKSASNGAKLPQNEKPKIHENQTNEVANNENVTSSNQANISNGTNKPNKSQPHKPKIQKIRSKSSSVFEVKSHDVYNSKQQQHQEQSIYVEKETYLNKSLNKLTLSPKIHLKYPRNTSYDGKKFEENKNKLKNSNKNNLKNEFIKKFKIKFLNLKTNRSNHLHLVVKKLIKSKKVFIINQKRLRQIVKFLFKDMQQVFIFLF